MDKLQYLFKLELDKANQSTRYQIIPHIKSSKGERFSSSYAGGEIHLEAENVLAALFGLHHLAFGIKSSHLAEFLGERHSRFSWRTLALKCTQQVAFTSSLSICIPNIPKKFWDTFCCRILELGYNSLLFAAPSTAVSAGCKQSIHDFFNTIQSYGIRLILEPKINLPHQCCVDPIVQKILKEELSHFVELFPQMNGLFLRGISLDTDALSHPLAKDLIQLDLIENEIALIEKVLKNIPLIYSITTTDLQQAQQQAKWLPTLLDNVGKQTSIAFSALAGDPTLDHLPPNPFWNALRQSPDASATPLIPLVNVGAFNQGSGLWPGLSSDLIDHYLSRCYRHSFGGVVVLSDVIPRREALLDAALWTTSQFLWKEFSSNLLLETWFEVRRPELNYPKFSSQLRKMRELTIALSKLRSTVSMPQSEGRALAETILSELKLLQAIFETSKGLKQQQKKELSFYDYFLPFARDARRITHRFMQQFQISIPYSRKDDDQGEGFWTEEGANGGVVLQEPFASTPGSHMNAIYQETYGLFI